MRIRDFVGLKGKRKAVCLTAYDYQIARILDGRVDLILVGDSINMVVFGKKDTVSLEEEAMLLHARAVRSAVSSSLVIADMVFGTYSTVEDGVRSGVRLFKETGVDGVKIEDSEISVEVARRLVDLGVPVMGHIGFLPTKWKMRGPKVRGRSSEARKSLVERAKELERAGVFSIVLEMVHPAAAEEITKEVRVPTVGIGSGSHTDGQILVVNDLLGLTPEEEMPSFVKPCANLRKVIIEAVERYAETVRGGGE